ncbi:hypothetical protein [Sulfolobus acidocaldarius]|uniref:Conserved protein n=4 Tax=Sulfolobus acidocaldarius TaxID=2285 RepID=Q4JC28_SULAC|nr:hypothetical protein [Sulfolobus acidocaldarius]AAY79651.1 conserved protein [Sulfolobus acidocaldarius DSM 639]AGE70207.1 hypothetical protein SacN8_01130 [Sulfolobus acidocaldarius N8]AGE72482.1 hypothetical protein SacRon12I_01130 [Sulfolobus acidocaldarius Ron12/I]ALU29384.1 hypothetical protein ATY89_05115 [Sulfolobus acidocaldarius]ALU32113.1 hypothetical protein ATZ20_08140 [Sulfolobus acidocaldarius]
MKFLKRFKEENDIHSKYEVISELFASRIGRVLGMPVLDLEVTSEGIMMDYLPDRATFEVKNLKELKRALAFEEWLLNIDLKEDHILSKNNYGYIIDHGHVLLAWKPLYYVQEILHKPVTRFKLWSDKESYLEGVEIIKSLDKQNRNVILKETVNEISEFFEGVDLSEYLYFSEKILDYRERILDSLFIGEEIQLQH